MASAEFVKSLPQVPKALEYKLCPPLLAQDTMQRLIEFQGCSRADAHRIIYDIIQYVYNHHQLYLMQFTKDTLWQYWSTIMYMSYHLVKIRAIQDEVTFQVLGAVAARPSFYIDEANFLATHLGYTHPSTIGDFFDNYELSNVRVTISKADNNNCCIFDLCFRTINMLLDDGYDEQIGVTPVHLSGAYDGSILDPLQHIASSIRLYGLRPIHVRHSCYHDIDFEYDGEVYQVHIEPNG